MATTSCGDYRRLRVKIFTDTFAKILLLFEIFHHHLSCRSTLPAVPILFLSIAMTIKATVKWNKVVGESYYIQLGPNDRFGWTEPEGHVYKIASENLDRLKDEIYRVVTKVGVKAPTSR